jgi:transcription elongation regulator 1
VLSAAVDPINTSGELKEKKKKKEKPTEKVAIPGTEWLKVTTNMGNVFWTHTGRKESVWTVPDEIKDIVEQMEREEQEKIQQQNEAEMAAVAETRNPKRKAEEKEHESRGKVKKPKNEESPKPEPPRSKTPVPGIVEDQPEVDEDEAWKRQMAEEMAMDEEAHAAPEPAPPRMTKAEAAKQIFDVPAKVDISIEEGKALFKVCFIYSFPLYTDQGG